jgi:hypothetical protein
MEQQMVHSPQAQMRGALCVQDGTGGLYLFGYSLNNLFKFTNSYGDVMQEQYLGDVVSWREGFIASFAAPLHGPGDGVSTTMFTRYTDEPTGFAILFTGASSTSGPCCAKAIMNDPTKYAAEVKAAMWGDRSKGQLVVFWKEYDVPADVCYGSYAFNSAEDKTFLRNKIFRQAPRHMAAIVDVSDVSSSYTTSRAKVVHGPELLSNLTWRHQERFITTPNGDIVWPMISNSSPNTISVVRLRNPAVVNGGWSQYSPCDCIKGHSSRTCTNPVPANGGANCPGEEKKACTCKDQPAQYNSYPKGLDPLLQDAESSWNDRRNAATMRLCPSSSLTPSSGSTSPQKWESTENQPCADSYSLGDTRNMSDESCKRLCEENTSCSAAVMFYQAGNLCRQFSRCSEKYNEAGSRTFVKAAAGPSRDAPYVGSCFPTVSLETETWNEVTGLRD